MTDLTNETSETSKGLTEGLPSQTIELVPIDSVQPYERNPRKNADAVAAVAESIQRFGFNQPIVVDSDGVIVVGDTRWRAAKKLGLETVPVLRRNFAPDQARAYRVADNSTGDVATWDAWLLGQEVNALADMGIDWAALGLPVVKEQDEADDQTIDAWLEEGDPAPVKAEKNPQKPPHMAWALVGVPLRKYGMIADQITGLAELDDVFVEVRLNDADPT